MRERDGRAGPLHGRTRAALARVAESGGKAIVMVPRRGWSPHLSCRECGQRLALPELRRLAGRSTAAGATAPLPPLRALGAGARRVPAVRLGLRHPPRRRHRARRGTGRRARRAAAGLQARLRLRPPGAAPTPASSREFDGATAGILIGTQMVAKGHDFPDVVLSVVVDADSSLRFPDFRAEERTFALVAQLAGRSGRGPAGGRVLVQTLAPGAEAIRLAARHDAAGFLAGELERRRRARLSAVLDLDPGRALGAGGEGRRQRGRADRRPPAAAPAQRRDAARAGAPLSPARPRAPPAPGEGARARPPPWAPSARPSKRPSQRRALRGVQLVGRRRPAVETS